VGGVVRFGELDFEGIELGGAAAARPPEGETLGLEGELELVFARGKGGAQAVIEAEGGQAGTEGDGLRGGVEIFRPGAHAHGGGGEVVGDLDEGDDAVEADAGEAILEVNGAGEADIAEAGGPIPAPLEGGFAQPV
jgi:hypothetical protein